MPINYARRLIGRERSVTANRHLGVALAFVAGATNAGGFVAVLQYTSHVTGMVSAMADHLALGAYTLVLANLGGVLSFLAGAMATAVLVNFARRRAWRSEFAIPLLVEALLLLGFGVLGTELEGIHGLFVPATVMLLCFIMGLQNALISKISRSEIRTTHLTGIVTDLGIELGRLVYWNAPGAPPGLRVVADRVRLRTLLLLALAFFVGGVVGALGFKQVGYVATVPLAIVLVVLASVPAFDDLATRWRVRAGRG